MLQFIGFALSLLAVVYTFLTLWSLRKNIVCHNLDQDPLENSADNDILGSCKSLWHSLRRRPNLLLLSTMACGLAVLLAIPGEAAQKVDIPMAGPIEVSNEQYLLLVPTCEV